MSTPFDNTEVAQAIARNVASVRSAIEVAALKTARTAGEVTLLAVTKYATPEWIRCLHELGLRDFGESRVQRCAAMRDSLRELSDVRWHLIGHLQRNKAKRALEIFSVLHSLDSTRLARELESRAAAVRPPRVYVEVNVSEEPRKTGLPEDALEDLLAHLRDANLLHVEGLMTMAPRFPEAESARPVFRRLRALRDGFVERGLLPPGAGLSMGMSNDFRVAVEEGATVVRVGSLLFQGC